MLTDRPVHATLPAANMERAKKFYNEKLGLVPASEAPAGVFYQNGGTRFFVFPSSGASNGSFTQMGITVDDIEAEVNALKSRGVKFEEYNYPSLKTVNGVATTAVGKSAWFKDSEGNLIGLVQFNKQM
jgi:predicted enzyme related to lactoylglutathione lyase